MSGKDRRFAPPPPHWPGHKPSGGPATPARAVVQPFTTFNALRTARAASAPPGDELLHVQHDQFLASTADRGLRIKPSGTYNFVRVHGQTRNDGHTYISARNGHAHLSGGRPVLYAGTLRFDNGQLEWWSNYSGTYQPMAAFRQQAKLPDDRFVPWQRLQMGGNGLQRGMLSDRRPAQAPAAVERPKPPKAADTRPAPPTAASVAAAPQSKKD